MQSALNDHVATALVNAVPQLIVRTGRLWQDIRHEQLAMDELSNQIDRLTALERPQRAAALAELVPSKPAQRALPNVKLQAQTVKDQAGTRLVVSIHWDRKIESKPLALVGWIDAAPKTENSSPGAKP